MGAVLRPAAFGGRATTTLTGEVGSVRVARRFAADVLRCAAADIAVDDLLLVVSEMVTYVVRQGAGPISLAVDVHAHGVRVEVADAVGPRQWIDPARALRLVAAVSRDSGVVTDEAGGLVWAEL